MLIFSRALFASINQEVGGMLSNIPIMLDKVKAEDLEKEILRAAIIAELDAINLYEQMASLAKDKNLRTILLDVAKEEKAHVGEFQALLLTVDEEQVKELQEGKEEVDELIK
jgi:rubrerythrin